MRRQKHGHTTIPASSEVSDPPNSGYKILGSRRNTDSKSCHRPNRRAADSPMGDVDSLLPYSKNYLYISLS